MSTANRSHSYAWAESRTISGQLVKFSCPSEFAEEVEVFLREKVRTLEFPTTHRVNVQHGGYVRYSRYDIQQRAYAGGGDEGGCGGYIEVLEIKDPPQGKWGIVIHEWTGRRGSVFSEWETLEAAREAFQKHWSSHDTAGYFPTLSGFRRFVKCGALCPWFYAIGNQELVGDYAFPEDIQDDPVFCFGKQFVVFDEDRLPSVKTCVGTRYMEGRQYEYPYKPYRYRLVYWEDGSVWNECADRGYEPRPIEEKEEWIAEAVQQFRALLAGRKERFEIKFLDGAKFVGRVIRSQTEKLAAAGDYLVSVRLKGKSEAKEGWVDFTPSPEAPDIVQYVTQQFTANGETVELVKVKKCRRVDGKKWRGVFYNRSS